MELITLGTSAAYPTVTRACSGYLIREGTTTILVDAGSGVTRNLMRWISPSLLDAIIISHFHQDHFIDIYPLYYFLAFHPVEHRPLDVYAPEGARDFILQLFPPGSGSNLDTVYNFKPLRDRGYFTIGDIECQSIRTRHSLTTYGVRVSGRHLISYSSDTGFDEVLYDIASGSDIFICEATMQQEREDLLHLTSAQAGNVARKARVKKLVLTHIWPDFEPVESLRMAAEHYDGPIIMAEDNMQIFLDSDR
ncbi:MAG TPA: MBL fold metallo-hydrolase [Anaerolineae bacterium]|jgi:ribonuclease BN (tRNA processing enzyme)|nr:MBL fold metallo-hydrolase [Anaerolineae bacterium]